MIDYQVQYAEVSQTVYTVYSENLVVTAETITGLTPGTNYKFIVKARNVIGFSEDS